jgi:hypothetical protein
MPYTNDPVNSATDRVRLYVGDTYAPEEGLTDEVYQYLINTTSSETAAAIQALKYLVAKYASYVTEKAGGLFVKESEKYEQYRNLLDMWIADPRTAIIKAGLPYAGGISMQDIIDNNENLDNVSTIFRWGEEEFGF